MFWLWNSVKFAALQARYAERKGAPRAVPRQNGSGMRDKLRPKENGCCILFHVANADQLSDVRWKTPIGPTIVIPREGPPRSGRALAPGRSYARHQLRLVAHIGEELPCGLHIFPSKLPICCNCLLRDA
jgi:hypothetical protein